MTGDLSASPGLQVPLVVSPLWAPRSGCDGCSWSWRRNVTGPGSQGTKAWPAALRARGSHTVTPIFQRRGGSPLGGEWRAVAGPRRSRHGDAGQGLPPRPGMTLGLTAVGVGRPREVGEDAGLAGEGHVAVQEAAAAREAVLRVAAPNLRTGGRLSGPARLPPRRPRSRPRTHQAVVPPAQRQDRAGEAGGQSPVAGQQPVHVACSAHGVAAQHVDGLVQVVLHLVLRCGWRARVRGCAAGALPSPGGPALATEPRGVHWAPFPTSCRLCSRGRRVCPTAALQDPTAPRWCPGPGT